MKNLKILHSRLKPPEINEQTIILESLIRLFKSKSAEKLILINAPAGYGKSTNTCIFLNREKYNYAWIRLNKNINTEFLFLLYVSESIREINSNFGKSTINAINNLSDDIGIIHDKDVVLEKLINIFNDEFITYFKDTIYLVLDDLHEIIEYKWINQLTELLIFNTSPNLKIIITSRYLTGFNTAKYKAKRIASEISKEELSFRENDIKQLAKRIYNSEISDTECKELYNYFEGWVTGLHLLFQTSGKINDIVKTGSKFISDNIFNFFAEEIFNSQDDESKEFLLKSSFLDTFDDNICIKLFNNLNSSKIIKYLDEKNIFIEKVKQDTEELHNSGKYYYNYLFKTFLNQKAAEYLGKEFQKTLNIISEYFISQNNFIESIDLLILANDFEKAFKLFDLNFNELIQNSNFEKLWLYLEKFENNVSEHYKILYYKSILYKYYKGDINTALELINNAIKQTDKSGDKEFYILCIQAKAEILINQGKEKVAESIKLLKSILSKSKNKLINARINYLLGSSLFNLNKLKESEKYLEIALSICSEEKDNDLISDIYSMLGNINIIKGEFTLSNHYYTLTLNKTKGLYKKLIIQANLTILYSRTAKFEQAKQYLDSSYSLLNLFRTPIFEILYKMTEYSIHFESGNFESAEEIAKEINKIALKLNNNYYIYLSYIFLAESNYYKNNFNKALEYFRLSSEYLNKSNKTDALFLELYTEICNYKLYKKSDLEKTLIKVGDYFKEIGTNYDTAFINFYTALYYYNKGLFETAITYLNNSLSISAEKEYFSFLLREYILHNEMFTYAEKNSIQTDLINKIKIIISEINELEWIDDRFRKYLNQLKSEQYDIKMYIFGRLEFHIKNKPVDESIWKRKIRKLILCYLLYYNNAISKDKIIELFFKESSLENADNIFHQAISNIRLALKTETEINQKEKSVKHTLVNYEGKMLKLGKNVLIYSDAAEFDNLLKKASAVVDNLRKINYLKTALNLYKGDALEGFYDDWSESIRNEYKNKYIKAMEQLIELLDKANKTDEIETYCDKLLQTDNLNDSAHYYKIKLFTERGNIHQAKQHYERFKKIYHNELNEEIPKNLNEKIRLILNNKIDE